MHVEIKRIAFGSAEYESEIQLKSRILREPLGLKFSSEELRQESGDIHLGAFVEGVVLGCLILKPQSKKVMKMRQVAVDAKIQGLGIGRKLVAQSEMIAEEMGCLEIDLNARQSAIPFYLALGYEIYGEPFEEVTLPHRKMRKKLTAHACKL